VLGRLFIVGGVAWLAALALFAALLQWSAPQVRLPVSEWPASSALARELNQASQPPGEWPSWAVTRATSAHNVIVIDVDAERPEEARQIALEIVKPLRDRYEEVLIYVKSADAANDLTVRRIQWTPRGGYVERDFSNPR
jgi:hypothetical protein